jgi:uncharacterized protein YbjT (DUF2867 family)
MPMRPKLYTIESLSVEMNKDRRAVAKALRGVPPDGKVGPRDGWLLSTALKALAKRSGATHRSNGNDNLDEAMRVAEEFQSGLERADKEPDLRKRRKILIAVGPLFGRLCELLESDDVPFRDQNERWMSDFVRERILADALVTFCVLGAWQLEGAAPLPLDVVAEAVRQGVNIGSLDTEARGF